MYEYDDDRRWPQRVAIVAVVGAIAAGMFVFLRGGADRPPPGLGARVQAATPATRTPVSTTAPPAGEPTTETAPATSEAPPEVRVAEPAPTAIEVTPKIVAGHVVAAVEARTPPAAAPAAPDVTTTTVGRATAIDELGYPAAPDGTPLPVIATYDVGSVTLAGHVPSEAARERLIALARANSQDGGEIEVRDRMITNERVPLDVGVRVIESNSPRFGEGAAEISVEHAAQLDRVGAILHALPNVTALVVGHADQRGDAAANLELSNERATAVVDYLIYLGVAPARLSSQAAGEEHLLTLADDEAALALNRRTEFVLSGILVG